MVTHELDLRAHPEFLWSVTDEVFASFMLKVDNRIRLSEKIVFIDHNGVSFKPVGHELWRLRGFSTKTVPLLGIGPVRVQSDLNDTIEEIVTFAKAWRRKYEA